MRLAYGIAVLALLAGCASTPKVPSGPGAPGDDELPTGSQGVQRKVGNPYKVAGEWYHPKEDPFYDEVGYASWYGTEFHNKRTANGELYNMNALTAAHKTLPLPTYVKVTNLENGRTLVLRVNDRGPFVKGRILDVSRRGAQLLGFDKQGVTKVRVQASDEKGNVLAQSGRPPVAVADAGARPDAVEVTEVVEGDSLPAPTDFGPQPTAVAGTQHFIQVGAYANRANADTLIRKLKTSGYVAQTEPVRQNGATLWRVRIGPFDERMLAERSLDRVVADGFYGARIFTESSR
ncbi:MAG: septal ring lytic transglycosylase RlpA family protein [Alphaproteobacteria bacterium]|nr:MAG: septal ring lytic transglycosylase RlpA family protein [Alphaproteobacteria bacterium]